MILHKKFEAMLDLINVGEINFRLTLETMLKNSIKEGYGLKCGNERTVDVEWENDEFEEEYLYGVANHKDKGIVFIVGDNEEQIKEETMMVPIENIRLGDLTDIVKDVMFTFSVVEGMIDEELAGKKGLGEIYWMEEQFVTGNNETERK